MTLPSTTYDQGTILNPTTSATGVSLLIDMSRFTADYWSAAENTDKRRARFATGDGTELAFDILEYDHASQTGWARVFWPGTLATSGTQQVRAYPPVSGNSMYLNNNTYGKNNAYPSTLLGYYPLMGNGVDRSVNDRELTSSGDGNHTYSSTGGKVGGMVSFPRDNSRLSGGDGTDIVDTFPLTLMIWARVDSAEPHPDHVCISCGDFVPNSFVDTKALLRTDATNRWRMEGTQYGGLSSATVGDQVDDVWQHVAGIWNSTGDELFVDGVSNNSSLHTTTVEGIRYMMLGAGSSGISGDLDQAWFIQDDVGAGWIETEHAQTDDQASFWGTWTNVPAPSSGPVDDNCSDFVRRLALLSSRY